MIQPGDKHAQGRDEGPSTTDKRRSTSGRRWPAIAAVGGIALCVVALIICVSKYGNRSTDVSPGPPEQVVRIPASPPEPNRTFNSELSLDVAVRRGLRLAGYRALRPDYGASIGIGKTPSREPLDIPQCIYWFVRPTASRDMAAIAREILAKQIPGLSLQAWPSTDDDDLEYLADLTELQMLWLPPVAAVTDAGLAHLSNLTKLRELHLAVLDITDEGLSHLADLTELDYLDLSLVPISDAGLAHLAGMTKMQELRLEATHITDAGLANIAGMTEMQVLDLRNTKITDAGLVHLAGLTDLQTLYLRGTNVTDGGVEELKKALPDTNISR